MAQRKTRKSHGVPAEAIPARMVIREVPGSRVRTLNWPHGMFATEKRLYVSDYKHDRLVVYSLLEQKPKVEAIVSSLPGRFPDPSRLPQDVFKKKISPKKLYFPAHLWVASGRFLVTDLGNNRLLVYDDEMPSDKKRPLVLDRFRAPSGNNTFMFPNHIFVRRDRVYVSDTMNHRILIFPLRRLENGCKCQEVVGPLAGLRPAGFKYPRGIWADDEHLSIADSENNRLVIFPEPVPSAKTEPRVFSHCDAGTRPRKVKFPIGFTVVGGKGILLDHFNDRAMIFNSALPKDGERPAWVLKRYEWGGRIYTFHWPRDMVANRRFLFVTDMRNGRIVAFKREDVGL